MSTIHRTLGVLTLSLVAGCGGGGASSALPPSNAVSTTAAGGPTSHAATAAVAGSARTASSFNVGALRMVQVMHGLTGSPTGTVDITPAAPVTPGDLLVAGISMNDGGEDIIEQPSGWPPVDRVYYSSSQAGLAIFTHVVTAADVGASFHFMARPSNGTSPSTSVAVSGMVIEVANANTSSPVAGHASYSGSGWGSETSPTVTSAVSGAMPIAFFMQRTGGVEPQDYFGSAGWSGTYDIVFGAGYQTAMQTLVGTSAIGVNASTSATESWSYGVSGPQLADLVMIAPGSGSVSTTATPPPATASTPAPSAPSTSSAPASGAAMMHTMVFYSSSINSAVPASTMLRYADMVETDQTPSYANNFMNGGGREAIMYTDPFLVPFCNYSNSCTGPLGDTGPETSWLHDASGNRLRTGQGQNALNPMQGATQSAYHNYVSNTVGGNAWTNVLMDDTGVDYDQSYFSYKFGANAREYSGPTDWLTGNQGLAQASTKPVIFNGGYNDSSIDTFLRSSNVAGRMVEGCVVYESGRVNISDGNPLNTWSADLNKLLEATNADRQAICLNYNATGGDVAGDRLYAVASQWLVYNPTYSIAFPNFSTGDTYNGSDVRLFSEYQIVPTQPVQSPGSTVANLASGSVYVREFGACYQNGSLIGACAAVVNPDGHYSHAVSGLTRSYSRQLVLDAHSATNGGTATWTGGTPSSLPAVTGAILLQ